MPFDYPNQSSPDREIVSSLVQQADEAWEAKDRATCIDLIEQIYDMLDVSLDIDSVAPPRAEHRTPRRLRSVVGQY